MNNIFVVKTAGGSMRPFIKGGSAVFVEKLGPQQLEAGDAVLYTIDGKNYIHRIWKVFSDRTSVYGDRLNTRFLICDDAGIIPPQFVPAQAVTGRLITPLNGFIGLISGRVSNFIFSLQRRFIKLASLVFQPVI